MSTVQKRSAEFHHSAENPKPTRTQLNAGSIYLVSENDPQGSEVGIATIRDETPDDDLVMTYFVRMGPWGSLSASRSASLIEVTVTGFFLDGDA